MELNEKHVKGKPCQQYKGRLGASRLEDRNTVNLGEVLNERGSLERTQMVRHGRVKTDISRKQENE